jgi:hypothetical protein
MGLDDLRHFQNRAMSAAEPGRTLSDMCAP